MLVMSKSLFLMASANSKHLQQFRECAKRGIHILSMKVPTFDMNEYSEIIDLVKKAGIVCQIELEMHYNPVVNLYPTYSQGNNKKRPIEQPKDQPGW